MLNLSSPRFLRSVVWLDAVTGLLLGALHLALTDLLAAWFGLPTALLQVSGLLLLGFAGLAITIARGRPLQRRLLWCLVGGNLLWAAASLALWAGPLLAPTLLGQGYLLVHAVAVAGLAELQWWGARRPAGMAAA